LIKKKHKKYYGHIKTKIMSFGSLVSKLVRQGKSKEAATKIAGSVANAKMKGAGSGPTAKQKARSGSAAKMMGPQGLGQKGNDGYSIGSPATLKDACYKKVKAQYKVFPSAYASGAIAKCRKKG
jgi:hypothetical protein